MPRNQTGRKKERRDSLRPATYRRRRPRKEGKKERDICPRPLCSGNHREIRFCVAVDFNALEQSFLSFYSGVRWDDLRASDKGKDCNERERTRAYAKVLGLCQEA